MISNPLSAWTRTPSYVLPPTTEAYAAPEQLSGGPFDERSDLFSLGAILYEAFTGERPAPVPRAEIARRLTVSRPGLPRSVRATVCSLLAESPGKRPASAEQVLDALEPSRVYRTAGEGLVPSADTLPFPLASILWHFEAEPDEAIKVDYLLKFFEALAQFAATVLLSACISDSELFETNRFGWFGVAEHRPIGLQRASFGAWVELTKRLAGTLSPRPRTGRQTGKQLLLHPRSCLQSPEQLVGARGSGGSAYSCRKTPRP